MASAVRRFTESFRMASSLLNRVRSHRYVSLAVFGTFVLVVACLHVWQRVTVMQLVKEVGHLRAEQRDLLDESRKVQSEIAALSMSSRIEQYARDSLGLGPVELGRLYTVSTEAPRPVGPDELATVISSIKRVTAYLPSLAPAEAAANELDTAVSAVVGGR